MVHSHERQGRLAADVVALLLTCGLAFFAYQGRFDYIETEGLRALVAAEMVERGGPSMPTVHHRPYVNKPPLYAWTTTLLAQALGRFDEQVARLPSSISATLLTLVLYAVGRRWGGREVGLAAAAFTLTNLTVLDYGFRAELDMPFTCLLTAAFLLLWPALHGRGAASMLAWLGVYAAATAAAMWKAPHSLVFLGLGLLAYSRVKRRWWWMLHPGNLVGAALSLAVLGLWLARVLGYAGGKRVGTAAGSEVVNRLAPGVSDLVEIPLFPVIVAVVALPASLFVLADLWNGPARGAAQAGAAAPSIRARLRQWWKDVAADPFAEFLLLMLLPNLVFLGIAPAKSARYVLPLFPLLFLLSAHLAFRRDAREAHHDARAAPTAVDRVRDGLYAAFGGLGGASLILSLVLLVRPGARIGDVSLGPASAWLAFAVAGVSALACARWERKTGAGRASVAALLLVAVGCKPLISEVWWPARVRSDSQQPAGQAIDTVVPEGEPVFVLGRQEFPDTALYSRRPFYWIDEPRQARPWTRSPRPFFLMRESELIGDKPGMPDYRQAPGYAERLRFERIDRDVILFNLEEASP